MRYLSKRRNKKPEETDKKIAEIWNQYIQTRDQQVKDFLLEKYAYLVRYVLGRMKISLVPYLDVDDLESAGCIGLIKAMENYDPGRNVKFETYAYRRIQGNILDYVRQIDFLSRSSRERVTRFKKGLSELREKLGRNPTDEELVKKLNFDQRELKLAYFELSCEDPLPLDTIRVTKSGEEIDSNDLIPDKKDHGALNDLIGQESIDILKKIIDSLPEKEKIIISLYYYEDLTFKEIGEILKVSESRICQMHGKAIFNIELGLQSYGNQSSSMKAAA